MAEDCVSEKYRVLILGGCGFIGRHLLDYLLKHHLVSKVRIVDKVPPEMAYLNEHHKDIFSHTAVEFTSANLINPVSIESAFYDDSGPYDFVFNLAAETKPGQSDDVYREGIVNLSVNCAKIASKYGVRRFVEMSSGHVYSSEKMPVKETGNTDPWTAMARFKLQVEEELQNIKGLNYVVLRPPIVYGIGDKQWLMPRLIIGAVYKHLGETMKLLWNCNIKMNTVHVFDLCRAMWHVCFNGENQETFHVVDAGETTQGKIMDIIAEVFGINYCYVGTSLSSIAKVDMNVLVDDINDKHLGPWAEACHKDNIENTPLTPYLHQELLYDKHLNLDGTKLMATGFTYEIRNLTKENVEEMVNDYIAMSLFPKLLVA